MLSRQDIDLREVMGMTLEDKIALEELKARSYEEHARFAAIYSNVTALECKNTAMEHQMYAMWLSQLKMCRDKYNECKEILNREIVTSKDSADHKAAYAVVQAFKEIFENVEGRTETERLHDAC